MTPEQMEAERRRAMASAAAQVSPGRIDTPQLIVPGDPEGSTRVQLRASATGKKEWTVGSEGDREILINRVGVSTLHAKIVNDGNRWKVVDQLSANGTFVNGKRCNVSYLASGDRIAFGSVECTFQLPKGGGSGHAGEGPATSGGAAASGTRLKKVLVIAGIAFVITLVVLFLLLNRFG
jgi:FHA domain